MAEPKLDDFPRFLRYLVPGLILFAEVTIFLVAADPKSAFKIEFGWIKDIPLGAPLVALFLSGSAGFLLNALYNFIVWFPGLDAFLAVDYRDTLKRVVGRRLLTLRLQGSSGALNDLRPEQVSTRGAWRAVTGIWQERLDKSDRLKGTHGKAAVLADLMQAAGSAWIASLVAALTCVYSQMAFGDERWKVSIFELWLAGGFIACHFLCYLNLRDNAKGVVALVLYDELRCGGWQEYSLSPTDLTWRAWLRIWWMSLADSHPQRLVLALSAWGRLFVAASIVLLVWLLLGGTSWVGPLGSVFFGFASQVWDAVVERSQDSPKDFFASVSLFFLGSMLLLVSPIVWILKQIVRVRKKD